MYEVIFLIGRIIFGGFFILNGINHFTNFDSIKAYTQSRNVANSSLAVAISGLLILFGGLGIVFGIYIRLASLFIIIFLLAVTFKMHDYWNDKDLNMKIANKVNFMKNMALLGAVLIILTVPEPWPYSLL